MTNNNDEEFPKASAAGCNCVDTKSCNVVKVRCISCRNVASSSTEDDVDVAVVAPRPDSAINKSFDAFDVGSEIDCTSYRSIMLCCVVLSLCGSRERERERGRETLFVSNLILM